MVEGATLEMLCRGNSTVSSNLTLSAICIAHDFAWIFVRMSRKVVFYFLLSLSHFTEKNVLLVDADDCQKMQKSIELADMI